MPLKPRERLEADVVFIVCEYGVDPEDWMVRKYHEAIAKAARGYKFPIIITSGGVTDPVNHPGISEADIGELLLREYGFEGVIIKEQKAITTLENIRFSLLDHLESLANGNDPDCIVFSNCETIICADLIRGAKVYFFARWLFDRFFCRRRFNLFLYDFKRNKKEISTQILKTIVELIGYWVPWLEKKINERVKVARGIQ